jgi:DNA-binding NarL/FixJ family response regulator
MVAIIEPLPARVLDVLALVDESTREVIRAGLPTFEVIAQTDPETYLVDLEPHRARIAIVGTPPATGGVIDRAAALRRRRPSLRCVLINAREDVDERLRALELGFDAALDRETSNVELIGRLRLLARDRNGL